MKTYLGEAREGGGRPRTVAHRVRVHTLGPTTYYSVPTTRVWHLLDTSLTSLGVGP